MANFRNVFKRRSRRTGVKKVYRHLSKIRVAKFRDKIMIAAVDSIDGSYEAIVGVHTEPDVYPMDGNIYRAGSIRIKTEQAVERRKDALKTAPLSTKRETWSEFFSLKFYRFQEWFGYLYATAGFQKAGAWMPTNRPR